MYLDSFSSWSLGLSFVANRQCFLLATTFELLFTYLISTGNKKQFQMMLYSHMICVESVLRQGECPVTPSLLYCVQVFIITLEEFTTSTIKLIQWSLPLGHLDSRDSSIQGMQKLLVLDRCSVNVCICFKNTSVEGTPLFRGKVHFFWIPKPKFKLHSGDIQHPKSDWQQKGITW